MTEPQLLFVALGIALFMGILAALKLSPNLLAAVRTTTVLVLAWSLAWTRYPASNWESLSVFGKLSLGLSVVVLATGWSIYLISRGRPGALTGALVDRLNIGFAVCFAILLVTGGILSGALALLLVVATLFLASNQR